MIHSNSHGNNNGITGKPNLASVLPTVLPGQGQGLGPGLHQGQGLGSAREISPRSNISPRSTISPRGVGGTITNGSTNNGMMGKRLASLTASNSNSNSNSNTAPGGGIRHHHDNAQEPGLAPGQGLGDNYDQDEFDDYGEDFEAEA